MTVELTVFKRRTNVKEVTLSYDVSLDTYTSQIRKGRSVRSDLIATWTVTVKDDGHNRTLILTMDNVEASSYPVLNADLGWMDIKRISGGEPLPVFDDPIQVVFKESVTE